MGLSWSMVLHSILIMHVVTCIGTMPPRTRAQGKRVALGGAFDAAFSRPQSSISKDKGQGAQGRSQGHSQTVRREGIENVEGEVVPTFGISELITMVQGLQRTVETLVETVIDQRRIGRDPPVEQGLGMQERAKKLKLEGVSSGQSSGDVSKGSKPQSPKETPQWTSESMDPISICSRRSRQDQMDQSSKSQQGPSQRKRNKRKLCVTCGRYHRGVCRLATGSCFNCGQLGHFKRNCPFRYGGSNQEPVPLAVIPPDCEVTQPKE